jgi:hypothetical protein
MKLNENADCILAVAPGTRPRKEIERFNADRGVCPSVQSMDRQSLQVVARRQPESISWCQTCELGAVVTGTGINRPRLGGTCRQDQHGRGYAARMRHETYGSAHGGG